MNYYARRQGQDLGAFTFDELRRRREAGEFAGNEYVQCEGKSDWQPLDLVLQQGYRTTPPPLPSSATHSSLNPIWIVAIAVLGVLFLVFAGIIFTRSFRQGLEMASRQSRQSDRTEIEDARPEAVSVAGRPIVWTTNSQTEAGVTKRAREFRIRQWLDGYEARGRRDPTNDAEVTQFIRVWIARNYDGAEATNRLSLAAESDKLANDPHCTDPLVLTITANESRNHSDALDRYERALAAFPGSHHWAYPRLYADVWLASALSEQPERLHSLDLAALEQLPKGFTDGSFTPADQQELAEIFLNGWGEGFFRRNGTAICAAVHQAGPDYQWLALTLDGEREINEAWRARGSGYSDSVTAEGWREFNADLASAGTALTAAWKLQPSWPAAPERMITVSLGASGIEDMRVWFDRTTAAQIDYPRAWSDFRWGLRPRWYGNEEAMLALGKAAVATKRFDTDVPRKFVDSVYDVEAEEGIARGHHIFGRDNIWPQLQELYNGYINENAQGRYKNGWRTSYAVIAYYAGKYDVSRTQLEALDWKPERSLLAEWRLDASVWPSEIAARSGAVGGRVSTAEAESRDGDTAGALKIYKELNSYTNTDTLTKQYIHRRIVELGGQGFGRGATDGD